jgi:expansin (peptidoglycan-binding protein)
VITDSNHYIISAIQPETLILRCTQIRERSFRDKKPKDAGKSREKEPEKK